MPNSPDSEHTEDDEGGTVRGPSPTVLAVVDARCSCGRCEARTKDIYRMIGHCRNCGATPVLVLNRAGDEARPVECPVCGCYRTLIQDRLATPEEIPDGVG